MSEQTAVQKKTESADNVEFVAFGGTDRVKLNVQIVQNLIATKTKSGKTCSTTDAMKFIALCRAQRLNPFTNDAFLVGYDKYDKASGTTTPVFSLITAHVAFLKRAESSPEFEGMESGIILMGEDGNVKEREGDFRLPDEKVVGGWAKVYRKGRRPTYRRLSIAAMKPAYDTPFWSEEKAPGQIVKSAEADALRSTFPTLLGGLYSQGEIIEIVAEKTSPDLGMRRLVEVTTSAEEEKPQAAEPQPSEKAAPPKPMTDDNVLQTQLAELVTVAGYTFDHLTTWAQESGNLPDAKSLPGFDALPEELCKRWIKSKVGLLKGLEAAKSGAAA
jgi:phage recombination protein Bet